MAISARTLSLEAVDLESDEEDQHMLDWSTNRRKVAKILRNERVDMGVGAVIVFNIYLVVVETDTQGQGVALANWVRIANMLLLILYICELSVRVFVFRNIFFKDSFRVFDLCIVSLDVVCLALSDLPALSIFRIFRLMKLARAYKAMRLCTTRPKEKTLKT